MGRILAAFVIAFVAAPCVARGQGEDPERTAAARALFEEGMRAVDARDFETAADRLRRSNQLRFSPVVAYNLSLALIEIGRFVEASEHLRAVQRASAEGSEAHRLASQRLAEILPRLGRLRIDVTGSREGTEVRLDGAPVPTALVGVPQPADPGLHRVTLHRDDEQLGASEVTVASGELAIVSLYAPPAPRPRRIDALGTTAPAPVEREWWFWTLIGTGIAALAVGVVVAIILASPQPLPYINGDSGLSHPALLELP